MRFRIFLLFFVVSGSLTGCSIFDSTVEPSYTKIINPLKVQKATSLKLHPIISQRNLEYAGVKKSEYGLVLANIYTKPEPEKVFRQALEMELQEAGFLLGEDSSFLGLKVNLLDFFVEPQINYFYATVCGVVEAEITIQTPQGDNYTRKFKGISKIYAPIWYSTIPIWGDEVYASAFEYALRNFLEKSLKGVIEIVDLIENSQS